MVVWLAPDIPEIVPRLIGSLEHRAWDYCFRHFLQTVALKGSRARPIHEIQTTIFPQELKSVSRSLANIPEVEALEFVSLSSKLGAKAMQRRMGVTSEKHFASQKQTSIPSHHETVI